VAINSENEALARRWFEEVWGRRETRIVHELVLADSVCHTDAGDLVGPGPFLDYHARILRALPDLAIAVEEVLSQGDSVAVRWVLSFSHAGGPASFRGATWIRYRGGKMVEGWDCWNSAGLAQLLPGGAS
jgi:hypothetical protein